LDLGTSTLSRKLPTKYFEVKMGGSFEKLEFEPPQDIRIKNIVF